MNIKELLRHITASQHPRIPFGTAHNSGELVKSTGVVTSTTPTMVTASQARSLYCGAGAYYGPAETCGNIKKDAELLGMSESKLESSLERKVVLDLGSGIGRFARESALRRKHQRNYPSPVRIDSLNIRYSMLDYGNLLDEIINSGSTDTSLSYESNNGTKKVAFNDPDVIEAVSEAKAEFLGLDWHDLSSIPREEYDVILSVNGFPYYSDFSFNRPENEKEAEQCADREKDFLVFGNDSKMVFQQLIPLLKRGGVMMLTTECPSWLWKHSTDQFKNDFRDFFASNNCIAEVIQTEQKLILKISKQ